MTGIYKITNLINSKIYVGQSYDINCRWQHHKTDLRGGIHHNRHLQASWNKYGEEHFKFEVIEECKLEELNEKEKYWIKYYDALNNGYNFDEGGTGIRGYKHTQEEIDKMRLIQKPLCILQFNTDFQLIKRWIGGGSHIYKELKYTKASIINRCEHKFSQKDKIIYKDSYWVYEEEYNHPDFNWKDYLNGIAVFRPVKKNKKKKKKICQYDLNLQLIHIWNSYNELAEAGYIRNEVCTICNKSRGKKTHKGYVWAFEGETFEDGYFDNLSNPVNKGIEKRKIKVSQYDLNNNLINTFDSIREASIKTNSCSAGIGNCIKGKASTCNGFIWKKVA